MMSHSTELAPDRQIETDVVCTGCGCLCDDIELRIEGGRIVDARNACEKAEESFLGFRQDGGPVCLIEDRPASLEEGVERAAEWLLRARLPLVTGLEATSCEVQRAAVSLADRIGGCIDSRSSSSSAAATTALQTAGKVTCTLGEIRQRCDLFLIWRADPLESHPRLLERCGLYSEVKVPAGGSRDRHLVVVDTPETRTVQDAADEFIAIRADGGYEALSTLRALARGIELEDDRVQAATGQPISTWRSLVERMKSARYGVLIYDPPSLGKSGTLEATAAHWLVREMNDHTRFAVLPLAHAGNPTGARHVLAWQTGYPMAVGFHAGYPRYAPDEFSASRLVERGEADVILVVSGALASPEHGLVVTRRDRAADTPATVLFRTSEPGLTAGGTVIRMDGVPLPLRALIQPVYPGGGEILQMIERRVGQLSSDQRREPGDRGR